MVANLYFQGVAFAGDIPPLPTGLIEFDCSYTLISGGLVGSNFAGLNRLNYLLMDGNAYNASVPTEFGALPKLQYFYISDAFVSGDLSYMQGMPAIYENWIDVNPGLTGPVFSFIGALSTLASFSVTANSLTGTLPTELGNLAAMVQMWYYDNNIRGTIPSEIGNLVRMKTLELEGNALTGTMPSQICARTGSFGLLTNLGADCAKVNVSKNLPRSWQGQALSKKQASLLLANHFFAYLLLADPFFANSISVHLLHLL